MRISTGRAIDKIQRWISNRAFGRYVALKLKRQIDAILGYSLSTGCNPEENGECLYVRFFAPNVRTFVDVGANRGDWTQYLLSLAPNAKGVLYEPGREAQNKIAKRFGNSENITLRNVGCAESSGLLVFDEKPDAGETSSFVLSGSSPDDQYVEVEVVRLDEDLSALNVGYIDLLKIDAEGFDFRVLMGMRKLLENLQVGLLQFEYNSGWANVGATLFAATSYLNGFGYTVFAIRSDGLWRFDGKQVGEYFRYSNFLAVSERCMPLVYPLAKGDVGSLFSPR